jgi:hypothetical protein
VLCCLLAAAKLQLLRLFLITALMLLQLKYCF